MKWVLWAVLMAFSVAVTLPAYAYSIDETDPASLTNYKCDKKNAGHPLDLSGAKVTFEDDFLHPSITAADGKGPWYAPVRAPFGGAIFLSPDDKYSPFSFDAGYLTIRMSKRNGRWYSGLMQTVNKQGEGFSQKYGYFEMRAQFPKGMSNWPAFYMGAVTEYTHPSQTRTEIDIIEGYGGYDLHGHHSAVHLWPAPAIIRDPGALTKHWGAGCYQTIAGEGLFDGQFHAYGAEVTPEFVIIYFDRKEIARFKTLPEFQKPLFMIVDLAYSSAEKRVLETPSDMRIDYVRAWQRPKW